MQHAPQTQADPWELGVPVDPSGRNPNVTLPRKVCQPRRHPSAPPLCTQGRLQNDTGSQELSIAWKYPSSHPSPKAAGHPSTDQVLRYEEETPPAINARKAL